MPVSNGTCTACSDAFTCTGGTCESGYFFDSGWATARTALRCGCRTARARPALTRSHARAVRAIAVTLSRAASARTALLCRYRTARARPASDARSHARAVRALAGLQPSCDSGLGDCTDCALRAHARVGVANGTCTACSDSVTCTSGTCDSGYSGFEGGLCTDCASVPVSNGTCTACSGRVHMHERYVR